MNKKVESKLKQLPKGPGVYFHKDKTGQIIYVGKAARLSNRVRQYFQSSRNFDPKTEALVAEIADIEWIETESEVDALMVEAELIRRYMPRFNILLRDDKSYVFVRVNFKSPHPTVTMTRRPLDDKTEYIGPFTSAWSLKKALKYLRRAFPYSTHEGVIPKRACLLFHLGLCPGLEENKTSLEDYRANLKKLMQYLRGGRKALMNQLKKDMERAAKNKDFENAAKLRDQYLTLKNLSQQIIFGDREFMDISKDQALTELAQLLNLPKPPKRIEGYDISHHGGTDTTASMVVFTLGIPEKAAYRKFKMRIPGNDDFAHMHEAISRRMSEKNLKDWGKPDLLLIDGGKGQVGAALKALDELNLKIPLIGLAKRYEQIIVPRTDGKLEIVELPLTSHVIKLLQRIRDESHRFAVSYHSVLKTKRQTASMLDEIPTIGPATRKKLIKTFGSLRGVQQARKDDLEKTVGTKKATILKQYLHKRD